MRLAALVIVLLAGAIAMLPAALLPLRIGGVRPALWVACATARLCCAALGVGVRCSHPARLRIRRSVIFPNHSSLLDSLVLLAVTPVRFLAAAEVTRYPVIGWMTRAIGTVFVARSDPASRVQARSAVRSAIQSSPYPPLVLFPEGRLGPGDRLFPFRYGAFEIAVEQAITFVPCALRYRPVEVAVWRGGEGEMMGSAAWRLVCSPLPVTVDVLPLEVVTPEPEDDPAALAQAARSAVALALGIQPDLVAEGRSRPIG